LTGLTNTAVLPPRFTPTRDDILRAEQLLVRMGMTGHEHTRWPTMSQGERGRALITRALMSSRLLLADEPATGLDLAGREELLDALTTVALEQPALSTVLVTHHLEELPLSTSHALRSGQVIASGPIGDTLTSATLSACFDHALHVDCVHGRWTVRSWTHGHRSPQHTAHQRNGTENSCASEIADPGRNPIHPERGATGRGRCLAESVCRSLTVRWARGWTYPSRGFW